MNLGPTDARESHYSTANDGACSESGYCGRVLGFRKFVICLLDGCHERSGEGPAGTPIPQVRYYVWMDDIKDRGEENTRNPDPETQVSTSVKHH